MRRRRPPGPRSAHRPGEPAEWIGGRVTVPVYVTEGEPYRPEADVWLELPSELVLGFSMIDPTKDPPSFSDTLREVMRAPLAGPPRRPARVRVADPALAAEARAALGDPGDTDVVVAPTPELDELVHRFARSLPPGDERESYLEGGRVPAMAVERLFRAAEVLYHVAPWKFADDAQVLRLDVAERGIAGAALSVIGTLGESLGVLVFPSLAAYNAFAEAGERAMRRRRPPARLDLGSSYLALSYERATDLPASMRREVATRGWPIAGPDAYPRVEVRERDGITRPLTAEDIWLATACADALTAFVTRHAAVFRGAAQPVSESYNDGEGGTVVRLTAPYEAFDLFSDRDDDEEPGPGWMSIPFTVGAPDAAGGSGWERPHPRIGRNEPCPCGSGKKYKRCHLGQDDAARTEAPRTSTPPQTAALHALDRRLAEAMSVLMLARFGPEPLPSDTVVSDLMTADQLWLPWSLYHRRVKGRTIAEHYVDDGGERSTAEERAWIAAQGRSWLGVWEVEGAEPGAWLDLHELLTGERRRVIEAGASHGAVPRTAVLGRVVDHGGLSVLCGVHPQPLPPIETMAIATQFRERLRRSRAAPIDRLREERLGRDLIRRWDELCRAVAERSRIAPRLRNRDGDEYVLINERYDFDPAVRAEIERRLAAMDAVVPPDDEDADRDYIFHREGAARPGLEDLIVGHVQVGEQSLSLETNSVRRANALRARVENALGDIIRHRRRRKRDAQRMVERMWERGPSPRGGGTEAREHEELEQRPEVQRALREMKEQHYAGWADDPLPALGGKTARQAIRTRTGRERVDALLKHIEYSEAALPAGERFDVSVLRRELGLT